MLVLPIRELELEGKQIKTKLSSMLAHLSRDDSEQITKVVLDWSVFGSSLHDLRPAKISYRHSFDLSDKNHVYHRARRMAPRQNDIIKQEFDVMLKERIITPSCSTCSFTVVAATEKYGKLRFYVDYRALNRRMKPDRFQNLKIQETFDELSGCVFFNGSFLFVTVYLDDVVIFLRRSADRMKHFAKVVHIVSDHGLRIKVSKCKFSKHQVTLLCQITGKDEVRFVPKKVEVLQNLPLLVSQTELRSFWGIAGYYRRFIRCFAEISTP